MKYLFVLFLMLVQACDSGDKKLPEGFEYISRDERTHFIYIAKERLNDRIIQREVGKKICTEFFQHEDYCEVYMWTDKAEIPAKLPIINRRSMVGFYEIKNGRANHKPLTGGV